MMTVVVVLPERECDSPHTNSGGTWGHYPEYYEATCFYLAVKRSEGDNAHFLIKGLNKNKTTNAINLRATRRGNEQRGDDAEGLGEDGGGDPNVV
jgi:hypothetical protein